MRRAVTIIGRFAFGGWALVTAILLIVACIAGVAGLPGTTNNPLYFVFGLLLYGLFGLLGGAVVGIVAAVLDRLIKRSSGKAAPANKAFNADPSVWPPAPKPPQ